MYIFVLEITLKSGTTRNVATNPKIDKLDVAETKLQELIADMMNATQPLYVSACDPRNKHFWRSDSSEVAFVEGYVASIATPEGPWA